MAHKPADTPLLEWCVGAAGALIFAVLVGFMVWDAATSAERPAIIEIEVTEIGAFGQSHVVEFKARNVGDTTASGVRIVGVLRAGQSEETRDVEFDYLARNSVRRGALVFATDPSAGELSLSAQGYADP